MTCTDDEQHSISMHILLDLYRNAKSEAERNQIYGQLQEEVAWHDETMKNLSEEDYRQKDGDAMARAIVDRWLINAGLKSE